VRIHAVVRLLAQHALSYVELGAAAAAEYRSAWVRRFVLVLAGLLTALVGLAALWGAGLIALWDTPWRLAYALISAGVLLAGAIWALCEALMGRSAGPSSGALKIELRKDVELFQQWKSTL
jgi:hypothetical protein